MLLVAKACGCVSRIAVLTLVLAFGVLPAEGDESRFWPAFDRPGVSLLSGVQGCGLALGDGLSEGSQCLTGWSVNHLLLDAAARFATEQGQAMFGQHFRIVNSLSYSPEGSGFAGGFDVVVPLASSTLRGAEKPELSAFFLQQGVTRWVDNLGASRNDLRFGAVHRFGLREQGAASGLFGVSTFVQQNLEFQHTRLVGGADYAGKWGRASLNVFVPTTGWRPSHVGHEERALAGVELGLRLDLTTTLSMSTAIGRWEEDDGLGGWSTNGEMAVDWRPHPWLSAGAAWTGLGTYRDGQVLRLAFSMPLGKTRQSPQWEGLGFLAGGPRPSAVDAWSPVDNVDVIQVARRETLSDGLVSAAAVRFLQERARSGDQISLEILLPDVASRDLDLIVTLGPGSGDNPAVPGVDYIDKPIAVKIRAGTSNAVVTIQLPLNAKLNEARSLSVTVTRAS